MNKKKFHVNPKTGEYSPCRAKTRCPYAGATGKENHYDTIEEAKQEAEKLSEEIVNRQTQLKKAYKLYGSSIKPFQMDFSKDVNNLLNTLRKDGFRPLLAGGAVRDTLVNNENNNGVVIDSKDLDFEVYLDEKIKHNDKNIVSALTASARQVGNVDEVGKSFGVLKMTLNDGTEIDLSLPRRESKTGTGHTGFDIEPDVNMGVEEASARRDFTLNSMMYDNENNVLIDPHGGLEDLKAGRLKHTSEAFAEDPLRVLRSFQFASRFGLRLDKDTVDLSKTLYSEYETISSERIQGEWDKWATKSKKPSSGLKVLQDTGWDRGFRGLKEVNNANMRTSVDKAAEIADKDAKLDRRIMLPAAIVSHIGKDLDPEAQDAVRRDFLKNTVIGVKSQRRALALANSVDTEEILQVKSISDAKLSSLDTQTTLRERIALAKALSSEDSKYEHIENIVDKAGVQDKPESDIVNGNDIMDITDKNPGAWMKEVLSDLRIAQARGEFSDKESGLSYAKSLLQKNR